MAGLTKLIVKADPWLIFLIFLGVMLCYGIVPDEQQILKMASSILLAVVVFGWFLILGKGLNENLPEDEQRSDILFVVSCFYGMLIVSASAIIKGVEIDESQIEYAILLVASFALSTFYVIYFVSTLFSDNQERFLDKEKLSAELVFILFIAFVVGVLVIQSRVRKFFI